MKIINKFLFGILLSFMVCFISVGYAALSDTLWVTGHVVSKPQSGVFISEVDRDNLYHAADVLSGDIDFTGQRTQTVQITVYNNTEYTYAFSSVIDSDEVADNGSVSVAVDIAKKTEIPPHTYLTFNATYTATRSAVLNTVMGYKFLLPSEIADDIVINNVTDRFKQILNDTKPGGEYEHLQNALAGSSGWSATGSYIGNVVGADDDDSLAVESLFTVNDENLLVLPSMDANGNMINTAATCLIKEQTVRIGGFIIWGGTTYDTMTLYMTTATTDSLANDNSVSVTALIFYRNASGEWVQVGNGMYEGTATPNRYSGNGRDNSFNTDSWRDANGRSLSKIIEEEIHNKK